jgi:hypothetical protein
LEEFGASGLTWGRIVEEIIVEELWKTFGEFRPHAFPRFLRNSRYARYAIIS